MCMSLKEHSLCLKEHYMLRSRYMHGCLSRNTLCSSQGTLCFAPGRHAVSQGTLCASLWYMAVSQGTLYAAHCLSKYTCELVSLMEHFYKPLKNSTRTRSLCFSRHASYTAKKVSFLLWFVLCWTVHFAVPGSHRLSRKFAGPTNRSLVEVCRRANRSLVEISPPRPL